MKKKYGIIVDGYSSGAGFANAFEKKEIECIHVKSQPTIPAVYQHTYRSEDYAIHFIFNGDLASLVDSLLAYSPVFVLAGAESGVSLADQLASLLNLPGNDIAMSQARRNKFLMQQELVKNNLAAIPSSIFRTIKEVQGFLQKNSAWPLVVKPVNSAGGDDVSICHNHAEVLLSVGRVLSKKINMLQERNDGVLVQEYVGGAEYVLNTVSWSGEHKLCELWMYQRKKISTGVWIYDCAELVEYNNLLHGKMLIYAFDVLNALGVSHGPAHLEVKVRGDKVVLIELGARIMGANLPFDFLRRCCSTPQALMAVNAYAEPVEFLKNSLTYSLKKYLLLVFLIASKDGSARLEYFIAQVKLLPSFYDLKLALKEGEALRKTVDYQTSPGLVYLSHESEVQLYKDLSRLRQLESTFVEELACV